MLGIEQAGGGASDIYVLHENADLRRSYGMSFILLCIECNAVRYDRVGLVIVQAGGGASDVSVLRAENADLRAFFERALAEAEALKRENAELRKANQDIQLDQCAPSLLWHPKPSFVGWQIMQGGKSCWVANHAGWQISTPRQLHARVPI